MHDKLNEFIRALRNRNYAQRTIDVYSNYIRQFLDFADRTEFTPEDRIPAFLDECNGPEERRLAYYAIKLFYRIVIRKECPYVLDRIRKKKRLPRILDREEVIRILDAIGNDKHRLMISFLYGSGLRVSEVTRIRICDLDLENLRVFIMNAKGQKDRVTLISGRLLEPLRGLIRGRRPHVIRHLKRPTFRHPK